MKILGAGRALVVALVVLASSSALSLNSLASAAGYDETTGGVAHTWTNYSNAGGSEGPEIPSHATVEIACKLTGFQVADGNTWWYQIASAPWSGQYYVSADAFYNNGATSGSLLNTPWDDPAVPDCGAAQPPSPQPPAPPPPSSAAPPVPTPSAHVTLAQGPPAPFGYRYAITLDGFAANSTVPINCADSVNPAGFYPLDLRTDASGHAFTESYCYSADGPDHWVVAGGVESNHVEWLATPATAHEPSDSVPRASNSTSPVETPRSNTTSATAPPATTESCPSYRGQFLLADGSVAYKLYDHYMWADGSPVVIDWRYFSRSASFAAFARQLPLGGQDIYRDSVNTDMLYALGTFTVRRTSTNCYAVLDHYDFRPSLDVRKLLDTALTLPDWMYQLTGAREFDVRASGTL